MRIALTAEPEFSVPPIHNGGIERIVDMLARGLVERGHEVTLFAHPLSTTAGRLVAWPGGASRSRFDVIGNGAALSRGRSMLFLCEHETQGLAYQQAIAAGLTILDWDPSQ